MSGDKKKRPGLSGAQIQMVIERYAIEDSEALAQCIGITSDHLRVLAHRFGISKSAEQMAAVFSRRGKTSNNYRAWKPWEEIYLKASWANTEMSEISRVLPSRTQSSIWQRAHKLGLKRDAKFRKVLQQRLVLASVEAPRKPEEVVEPTRYGEKFGFVQQYLIKNRPARLDVRENKPSARNYASGSLLGM